jgi:hypothetical protein
MRNAVAGAVGERQPHGWTVLTATYARHPAQPSVNNPGSNSGKPGLGAADASLPYGVVVDNVNVTLAL